MTSDFAHRGGPPPSPPILPPAINEDVFGPKRRMGEVRDQAAKRLKKHHKAFEKQVRKFLKKHDRKDCYVQFYDIGFRFEAVFTELSMEGTYYHGEALDASLVDPLLSWVSNALKLPSGLDAILLRWEYLENGAAAVLQMVAAAEEQEIKRLQALVEGAPRNQNPGA